MRHFSLEIACYTMNLPAPRALIAEDEPLLADALRCELARAWPTEGSAARPFPALVFVTAYDQYAVDAFDAGAVDYLLKPVQAERLQRALARLRDKLGAQPADMANLLQSLRAALPAPPREKLKWIKASVGKQIRLIDIDDVLFFQADTKYTRVVLAGSEALVRTPLKDLLGGLDPDQFWQIHRGTMVNVKAIEAAERIDAERMQVLVRGSTEKLPVSRTFTYLFRD